MKVRSRAMRALPASVRYRAAAAGFRLRAEQRLMLLDDLAPGGGTAVDAGAWWGPWTYWLSRRFERVWSFEPNPAMARDLRRAAQGNVTVEAVALSDRAGVATLYAPAVPGPDALGTLSADHRARDAVAHEVAARTLDSYDLRDVAFVKIDVENHERAVLAGARETLARWHPTVLIEIEQRFHDDPITEVFEWFRALGFEGWVRRNRAWAPLSSFDVRADQLAHLEDVHSTAYINNFVFVPASAGPPPLTLPGAASRRAGRRCRG